ncbi:MAG: TraB/GumN family protein [Treponema sp.]|nr:TraB/GumN family protein [Treponema sp.]MBQ2553462.1 TraB/GumN family protein [Treponema sp.]
MTSSGTENTGDSVDTEKKADSVPQTQKRLSLNGREIVLIGTAHVSAESITEVTASIENEKPDTVAIELDQKRLASLEDPESWRKMDIIKVLKKKQGFLMLANIVLAGYQKRMGQNAGVKPGDEMVAAINKAKEMNIPQVMVDREIATTLRRAWAANSLWGKCKLLSALIASAFSKEETDPAEIEKLKQSSEMDSMMTELSEYMPKVKQVLIDERDRYLASHIWESSGNKVLAVLGAGHLPGVEAHLNKLASGEEKSDCSDIDVVPKKSVAGKIISWAIPVLIVALIVLGFVFGGKKVGADMIKTWILNNSILAAIGTLLAGGHPLTILAAFVSAPITSLCPAVGVGLVAGLVQAFVGKPKVEDIERLQTDSNSFKGFYKNRILKVLLVFFLSSLGSAIGTFTAGTTLVISIKNFFSKIVDFFKNLFNK